MLALLLCGAASAKVNHYVGGFAQVGEWSLIPSKSDYSGSFGVAGGLGFQYELQAGKTYSPARFLLDVGVGATGGLTAYIQSSNRTETLFDQTGLNHQPFDYVYEIKDRKDKNPSFLMDEFLNDERQGQTADLDRQMFIKGLQIPAVAEHHDPVIERNKGCPHRIVEGFAHTVGAVRINQIQDHHIRQTEVFEDFPFDKRDLLDQMDDIHN